MNMVGRRGGGEGRREWRGGEGRGLNLSQILGITSTIASKCQKCPDGELDEMAERGGGKSVKMSEVSQILKITTSIASFNTYDGSVKCVQMVSLRRWLTENE